MKLTATYSVPGRPERVFAALTNPEILRRCIEGCESLDLRPDGAYEAVLRAGLGSIKGTFRGTVRMEDVHPPTSYKLIVEGRGTPGFVNGSSTMHLTAAGDATTIDCQADLTAGGLIASVGSRLIEAGARRNMDKFFEALRKELASTT